MAKRERRALTEEFKAQTVRLVRDSGKSIGVLARELDLRETVLRTWACPEQHEERLFRQGRPALDALLLPVRSAKRCDQQNG